MPIPLVHMDSCAFTMVDQHGQIVMRGETIDLPEMAGYTTFPEAAPPDTFRSGNAWVPMPVRPSEMHDFDWPSKTWIDRALERVKAARWAEVKRHRDLLEASGFPYLGKMLDSDERSVQRITTVVQAAQAALGAGVPFSIVWTCADNSSLPLDAVAAVGMPVALAQYADQLHQTAKTLRAQIESATSTAQVQAVSWPTPTSPENV